MVSVEQWFKEYTGEASRSYKRVEVLSAIYSSGRRIVTCSNCGSQAVIRKFARRVCSCKQEMLC